MYSERRKKVRCIFCSGSFLNRPGRSAVWFSAFDWGSKGREFESHHPDHFFALSFPVLTDRIFLCLDFTHRISSIYSNIIAPTENKQRTVKSPFSGVFCIDPLKILCLVRSLVLSKRLSCNCIESNILQKHTAK